MTFIVDVVTTTFYEVEANSTREAEEIALKMANEEYPKLDWEIE